MWAPSNTAKRDQRESSQTPHKHGAPEKSLEWLEQHPNYQRVVAPPPPIVTPPAEGEQPQPPADAPAAPAPSPVAVFHPAFSDQVRFQSIARPASDESATSDTAGLMAHVIRQDAIAPAIRTAAAAAIAGVPAGQVEAQIAAVHRWVRSHVVFRNDSEMARPLAGLGLTPEETEVLIRPADLLRMPRPAGDCDDYAMLTGAMLTALGIPVALVTIAADQAAPDLYSHVYLIAHTNRGDIAVDSSHGPRPGWYAPAIGKARIWEVSQPVLMNRLGLNGLGVAIDWNKLIQIGAETGGAIARNVTLPAGTYQSSGPQGTTVFRQPEGSSSLAFPTTSLTGGISTTMVLLLVAGFAFLMMARRS